jgi:hypothetical protein
MILSTRHRYHRQQSKRRIIIIHRLLVQHLENTVYDMINNLWTLHSETVLLA